MGQAEKGSDQSNNRRRDLTAKRNDSTNTDLSSELNLALRDNTRRVLIGLSILYGFFAIAHYSVLRESFGSGMIAISATTSIVYLIAWIVIRRWDFPALWANRVGFAVVLLVLINSIVYLYFSKDPQQTPSFSLLLIGSACLFLSTRWMVSVIGITIGSWSLVAYSHGFSELWVHFGFLLACGMIVSLI